MTDKEITKLRDEHQKAIDKLQKPLVRAHREWIETTRKVNDHAPNFDPDDMEAREAWLGKHDDLQRDERAARERLRYAERQQTPHAVMVNLAGAYLTAAEMVNRTQAAMAKGAESPELARATATLWHQLERQQQDVNVARDRLMKYLRKSFTADQIQVPEGNGWTWA